MSKPVGPYTPVVRSGEWIITSGQIGIADGQLADGLEAQVRQALANLLGLLEGEGAALTDVLKTTLFLADMGDYQAVNAIYSEFFGDHRPARSAVQVAALPLGAEFEIEAWARVGAN